MELKSHFLSFLETISCCENMYLCCVMPFKCVGNGALYILSSSFDLDGWLRPFYYRRRIHDTHWTGHFTSEVVSRGWFRENKVAGHKEELRDAKFRRSELEWKNKNVWRQNIWWWNVFKRKFKYTETGNNEEPNVMKMGFGILCRINDDECLYSNTIDSWIVCQWMNHRAYFVGQLTESFICAVKIASDETINIT